MGDHHNHNNHRHSSDNHGRPHSHDHSYKNQNNSHRNHDRNPDHNNRVGNIPNPHHHKSRPQGMSQYERPVGPTKPSRFDNLKQRFQNRFTEKAPTREQIEALKVKAEHARYSADVKVHKAREAKAERENPSGWRRLFAATQQPQRGGGRAGTRRPRPSQYYGGQGRGRPQMGDSILIGPGSFSGDSLMFSPEGGHVGDNMLAFQGNGQNFQNDMLSFHGNSTVFSNGGGGKPMKAKKSEEPMSMSFGEGAISMFKF